MLDSDNDSQLCDASKSFKSESVNFAGGGATNATAVEILGAHGRAGLRRAKTNRKIDNRTKSANRILDKFRSNVKKISKAVVDRYYGAPKTGAVENADSKTKGTAEGQKVLTDLLKSGDLESVETMCNERPENSGKRDPSPSLANMSILDFLMNRENCLDGVGDNISEVYTSLASSVSRSNTVSVTKEGLCDDNRDDKTTSTADFDSTYTDVGHPGAEEALDREDVKEACTIDPDDEIIKCVVSRDYFERSERHPPLFVSDVDSVKRIEPVVAGALEDLSTCTIEYKLFVINIAMQTINNSELSVSDLFGHLVGSLKALSDPGASFDQASVKGTRREELIVAVLDNCSCLLSSLDLEELMTLFKALFAFFYNFQPLDLIIVKVFGICREIVRRLQLKQAQLALKFIANNFVFFNSNLYRAEQDGSKGGGAAEGCSPDLKMEPSDRGKRSLDSVNNRYYVNVVLVLFERVFADASAEDALASTGDEDQAYSTFKATLKSFVEDTFYRENVEFRNYRLFMQILLRALEDPKHVFAPFVVLEMVRIFISAINAESKGGGKRGADEALGKKELAFRKMQSLGLLVIIATKLYNMYNRILHIPYVKYHDTRYLDLERGAARAANPLVDPDGLRGLSLETIKETVENYARYISIQTVELDASAGVGQHLFYVMLKNYCYAHNVQDGNDLILFLRVFRYLDKHNANYAGRLGKILVNINYPYVFNYPYSPYLTSVGHFDRTEERVRSLSLNLFAYYVLQDQYDPLLDCVTNLIYTTNENNTLKPAINFISKILSRNCDYMLNENIRSLLMVSLSDYNVNVRQQVIGIYHNFLTQFKEASGYSGSDLLKYIGSDVVTRMVSSTKDVNFKIRLAAIRVLHMFLDLVDIRNHLDVVSVLAQRSLDSYREQPLVKNALYNLLTSVFFKYALRSLECSPPPSGGDGAELGSGNPESGSSKEALNAPEGRLLEEANMDLLERLAKIILYKMESYKGKINPVLIMHSYFKTNYKVVQDPIGSYYQGNGPRAPARRVGRPRSSADWTEAPDSDSIVNSWLDRLLDLFLLKRSKGVNYYELAEVLSVFKLFGEVSPRLFVKHLVYFIPYLKIVTHTKMDTNQINLVILINNLIIIVYKYLDANGGAGWAREEDSDILAELNSINSTIVGLINYSSPIIIRSIVQLLSFSNRECVSEVREVALNYMTNIRTMLLSVAGKFGTPQDSDPGKLADFGRRLVSANRALVDVNVYRYAWQLGCVCEFNGTALEVLALFVEMFKMYNRIGIYNIAGLFVECCCRYLSNTANLHAIDSSELNSILQDLYESNISDARGSHNLVLVLYQLLTTYQTLSTTSSDLSSNAKSEDCKGAVKTKGMDKGSAPHKKPLVDVLYVVIHKYLGAFVKIVASFGATGRSLPPEGGQKGAGAQPDRDNRGLYMEIIEIVIVNRLTSVEELIPFTFVHLVSGDVQVQRVAEQNLKLIIKQDVNLFLNRFSTCLTALFHAVVHEFYQENFVLGLTGFGTLAAVQSILRIYLEVLQAKRSNIKLFVTSLLLQTRSMFSEETVGKVREIVEANGEFDYEKLKAEAGKGRGISVTLTGLMERIKNATRDERREKALEYFLYLHVNLVCVLLDGLTFKNKRDAAFALARIQDVVADDKHVPERFGKISRFAHAGLRKVAARIKNVYK